MAPPFSIQSALSQAQSTYLSKVAQVRTSYSQAMNDFAETTPGRTPSPPPKPESLYSQILAEQHAYLQTVASIRTAYAAGKTWPGLGSPPVPAAPAPSSPAAPTPTPGSDPPASTKRDSPATPPPPSSAESSRVSDGSKVMLGTTPWVAQTGTPTSVAKAADGSYVDFAANAGDRASFDPARKIRSELVSVTPIPEGKVTNISFKVTVSRDSVISGDFASIFQIHQADTRRADGTPFLGSPVLGLDLAPHPGFVTVRAESSSDPEGGFVPQRELGKVPFELGVEHDVAISLLDSHGGPNGALKVTIDGKVIVDQPKINIGWAYVDNAILYGGKPQSRDSYAKVGIYAGMSSGISAGSTDIRMRVRDMSMQQA